MEFIKLFIKNNADVNMKDLNGFSIFHNAIKAKKSIEVIKLLSLNSPDIETTANCLDTPLHSAAENEDYELTELLIKKGASVDVVNNEGKTPLGVLVNKIHILKASSVLATKEVLENADQIVKDHKIDLAKAELEIEVSRFTEVKRKIRKNTVRKKLGCFK